MLKTTILLLLAVLGLGLGASAAAQTTPSAPPAPHAVSTAATKPSTPQQHPLIKPGDRNCLRDTGSMIPAKKGQCLQGVFGRSYSGKELRETGQMNPADALRMLDPAVH